MRRWAVYAEGPTGRLIGKYPQRRFFIHARAVSHANWLNSRRDSQQRLYFRFTVVDMFDEHSRAPVMRP